MMHQSDDHNPYSAMAVVYDALIEDVDYRTWSAEWIARLKDYLKDFSNGDQIKPWSGLSLLEIGAGTGNMTEELIKTGLRITAVEPSEAMLSVLQEKLFQSMGKIRLFNGIIEDFRTKETFDVAAGFLDVLNYIPPRQLSSFFEALSGLVTPGGIATLDMSTPYKLENLLGQHTFAENHDEFAFIWENKYDAKRKWLDFEFALFSETEDGCFERHVESHRQYAHSTASIEEAAKGAGFELLCVLGDDFQPQLDKNSSRWHFWFKNNASKEFL